MTKKDAMTYAKLSIQSLINDKDENTVAWEFYTCVIKALSEPTIPLSVIEKIHDAIDNADADGFLDDEHGYYIGSMLTKEHVHEIIDKAVKECTHERS